MLNDFFARFGSELWAILLDTGVWLILGLAFAGVVHVLVPRRFMTRHLAGKGLGPIFKASMLGIPLPLCSCSVIPVAAGLRGSGASKGASAAFAISTPQTGEESVPLTWALFGPVYALSRPVLAVITAFSAGLLIDRLVGEKTAGRDSAEPHAHGAKHDCCGGGGTAEQPEPAKSSCCHEVPAHQSLCCHDPETAPSTPQKSCCHNEPDTPHEPRQPSGAVASWRGGAAASLKYGFGTLLRDLAPWLAVGLLLSALVAALVPEGWIESNIGTGIVPMLLMLLVGLPLYVCATSTTPLAYSLVVAGLSPGAALVLLLAGPATNAATMSWVVKDLGVRALVIYLATIAVFAVAGGWLFDALLAGTISLAESGAAADHGAVTVLQGTAAGLLVVLMLWALGERLAASIGTPSGSPPPASGDHHEEARPVGG